MIAWPCGSSHIRRAFRSNEDEAKRLLLHVGIGASQDNSCACLKANVKLVALTLMGKQS